ncbi:MAG: LysR family transcriptional regulator [Pseudomonadota bacterium]
MWDELQAAAEVFKHGTVSAAADELGVHRATIMRRIEALEKFVGGKLFYRHRHGYTPTDLWREIRPIAENTRMQLEGIRRRSLSQEVALEGNLIITSVDGVAPVVLDKISKFTERHREIQVEFLASNKLLQLELAEAHVAVRLGKRPTEPDYVVLPFGHLELGLFASRTYVERYGMPKASNLAAHRFVLPKIASREDPPDRWLRALVESPDLVLLSDKTAMVDVAVKAGVGVGFVPMNNAQNHPNLFEVIPRRREWYAPMWLVTHMDLHRSPKIQAFVDHCRNETEDRYEAQSTAAIG